MRKLVLLVVLGWCFSFGPSFAGPREDALAGIARCKVITDDRQFLDCLYGAVQPLRAELGLAPAPAFQARLVPRDPSAASPPPSETKPAGVAGAIGNALASSGNLRLAAYSFDPRGHFTVTLSDGSVWRQLGRDQAYADLRGPAASYYVNLKSSGNDHYLDIRGGGGPYRVERLH